MSQQTLPRTVAVSVGPKPRLASVRHTRVWATGSALVIALVAVAVVSAGSGQFPASPSQVVSGLFRGLIGASAPESELLDATLWTVRFPRLVLGLLVGGALGVGGALMQGVFANPLAEPGVIGISSGSAVGACTVIVLGLGSGSQFILPAAAFASGLMVTLLVYWLARGSGASAVLTLVLTGIAVNAVAGAVISLLVFVADTSSREQVIFWQMGSLNGATWSAVATTACIVFPATLAVLFLARRLDLLSLGDAGAESSGVNVQRLRALAIICVALLTSAAVAHAGMIGFVGLIVPHGLRLFTGPSHRSLLPLSGLGGALLLAVADLVSRTALPYADLPIGIFTALVGGPVFFLLLRTTLKKQGVL